MPLLSVGFIFIATLITSFISGIFGMAGGMLLMGALLVVLPVPASMILHGVIQFASNASRVVLWRSFIRWEIFWRFAVGNCAGLALLTALQISADKATIYFLMGLFPFLPYLLPKKMHISILQPGMPFLCGFLTTVAQLLSGVGGSVVQDQFYVNAKLDRRVQVANKALGQSLSHIIKTVYFGLLLSTTPDLGMLDWWMFMAAIGLAMLGNFLASKPLEKMSDVNFTLWSRRILLVIGGVYLFNAAQLWVTP